MVLALRDEHGRFLPGSKPPKGMQRKGGLSCVRQNGHSHMAEIGKKGYRAAVEKCGEEAISGKLQEWRRKHPTNLERIVAGWLLVPSNPSIMPSPRGEGMPERHYKVETQSGDVYYLDFAWPAERVFIEVDGQYWHNESGRARGPEWDAKRDTDLAAEGWRGIRLSQAEIEDRSGKARLAMWLKELSHDKP